MTTTIQLDGRRHSIPQAYHLAARLHAAGQPAQAMLIYQQILSVDKTHPPTLVAMAYLLADAGQPAQALSHAFDAWQADPTYLKTYHFYVRQFSDNRDKAVLWCRRGLEHHPHDEPLLNVLGRYYYNTRDIPAALGTYQTLLRHHPQSAEAAHMVAALSGSDLSRASNSYVSNHFDNFAKNFDEHLTGKLHYQTPKLLTALLLQTMATAQMEPQSKTMDITDLGCGTGLCGPYLESIARTLHGVDLSAGMLAQLRQHPGQRGYTHLSEADLESWLTKAPSSSYDACICADTLVYLGDLGTFFTQSARVLRPHGWLALSTEAAPAELSANWHLQPSGRYAHKQTYLESLAASAGFSCSKLDETQIRTESGNPIHGFLAVFRKTC